VATSSKVDPALSVRVTGSRQLVYTDTSPRDDRPPHVRAASGLCVFKGKLAIVQDDAAFIATVAGDKVESIALPRWKSQTKRDKLDLESCVVIDDALWAFGSGSRDNREQIARIAADVTVHDAHHLYKHAREVVGDKINIEGVAIVKDELWLFHRGNTGPEDKGPCIVVFAYADLHDWLVAGKRHHAPHPTGHERYDLGAIDGVRLGFSDAVCAHGRVFFLSAAEAGKDAIEDGEVKGSRLGVIAGGRVREAPLQVDGAPLKAEGLAFHPDDPTRAWVVIDPDDPDRPTTLYDIELVGPWT
jgi:hypothetical protein